MSILRLYVAMVENRILVGRQHKKIIALAFFAIRIWYTILYFGFPFCLYFNIGGAPDECIFCFNVSPSAVKHEDNA